jgi:hypothetical protein
MIVLTLGKDRIEKFTNAGRFSAFTYWLDSAVIYRFPETEEFYGRVVSVEPGGVEATGRRRRLQRAIVAPSHSPSACASVSPLASAPTR